MDNNDILLASDRYSINYSRKVSISYQGWDFAHSQTITFPPNSDVETRRAMIRQAYTLVRAVVLSDIAQTLPEIEAMVGNTPDGPSAIAALRRSLEVL